MGPTGQVGADGPQGIPVCRQRYQFIVLLSILCVFHGLQRDLLVQQALKVRVETEGSRGHWVKEESLENRGEPDHRVHRESLEMMVLK